jgi:hypothetical protein
VTILWQGANEKGRLQIYVQWQGKLNVGIWQADKKTQTVGDNVVKYQE